MTAKEIVALFETEVNRLIRQFQDPEPGHEAPSLDDLVADVWSVLLRLGRLLVSLLCAEALHAPGTAQGTAGRPRCPSCGQVMISHGQRPRTLVTRLGEVTLLLPRYRCRRAAAGTAAGTAGGTAAGGCGEANPEQVCPLLSRSQIRHSCTAEVWSRALELAAALPYRSAEALLRRFDLWLSDSTIEALVADLGGEWEAAQRETAQEVAAGRCTLRPATPPQRLYLLVDGRSVRVDGRWRELRVGVIFETDLAAPDTAGRWPPVRCVSSFASLDDADTFMARFFAEAQRRGVWDAQEVVLLADGAPWIWDRFPSFVFCGVPTVEILDFYHAAEHLQGALEAAYGANPARLRHWSEHLRGMLKAGELPEVLKGLRRAREKAPTAEAQHRVQLSLDYLERHRERVQYFRRHWEGYYIGSGQVESVCKQLGLRFKGCGMNWTEAGLNALLAVWNRVHAWPEQPLAEAA